MHYVGRDSQFDEGHTIALPLTQERPLSLSKSGGMALNLSGTQDTWGFLQDTDLLENRAQFLTPLVRQLTHRRPRGPD